MFLNTSRQSKQSYGSHGSTGKNLNRKEICCIVCLPDFINLPSKAFSEEHPKSIQKYIRYHSRYKEVIYMTTIQPNIVRERPPLLRSNPILNKLTRVRERTDTDAATYSGIAVKTACFLVATLIGIIIQLIVMTMTAGEPVWQTITVYENFTFSLSMKEAAIVGGIAVAGLVCQLLSIFIHSIIPVTGTLYSICQGYVISFMVFKVLTGYEYLGLEALLLTVAVVAAMLWLYSSGKVRDGKTFRTVLYSLILGTVGVSVLSLIGSLIPVTRPYVSMMLGNPAFSIALDILGLVIAALFLISDFSVVDTCVREGYPKKYEWYAAFGLVFTVIWIYLKILDLLMRFAGKNKSSND